jgi:hypothetical protein
MITRQTPRLAALVLLLAGCSKPTVDGVEVACELLFECDCGANNKYADVAACMADLNSDFDEQAASAKMAAEKHGLIFDQSCIDRTRQVPADLDCDLTNLPEEECSICIAAHGDKPEGARCTQYADEGYSDCDRHLYCNDGVCADFCRQLGAGEACERFLDNCGSGLFCDDSDDVATCKPQIGPGGACPGLDGCADGLYCADADLTCKPIPNQGEPCGDGFNCADGLACAPDTTCQPPPTEGEPCTVLCAEYFVCEASVCIAAPGVGQPCIDGNCGPGAECDEGPDLCVEERAEICDLGED